MAYAKSSSGGSRPWLCGLIFFLNLAMPVDRATAQAQPPAATDTPKVITTPIGDLIGLDPGSVRARLSGLPQTSPVRPMMIMATPEGPVTFLRLDDLFLDQAGIDRQERFGDGDYGPPYDVPPYQDCGEKLVQPGAVWDQSWAGTVLLMFQNNKLAALFVEPAWYVPTPEPVSGATPDASKKVERWKVAQHSPYLSKPGALLLDDGLGFLTRWTKVALPVSANITTACHIVNPVAPKPAPRDHFQPDADVVLAPLIVLVPFDNAHRATAYKNGHALLNILNIGEALPQSAQEFAGTREGVRLLSGSNRDFAVLSIDMGARQSNHIDNTDDTALIGVKADKVAWIIPSMKRSAFMGIYPKLLCLDATGVPGRVREKCDYYGNYTP